MTFTALRFPSLIKICSVVTFSANLVFPLVALANDNSPNVKDQRKSSSLYESYRRQAASFSDKRLIEQLNQPKWSWAFITPSHLIDELLIRANESNGFFKLLELITIEIQSNPIRADYFEKTIVELLSAASINKNLLADKRILNLDKLYRVTNSQSIRNSIDLFYDAIVRVEPSSLETEVLIYILKRSVLVESSNEKIHITSSKIKDVIVGRNNFTATDSIGLADYFNSNSLNKHESEFLVENRDFFLERAVLLDQKLSLDYCKELILRTYIIKPDIDYRLSGRGLAKILANYADDSYFANFVAESENVITNITAYFGHVHLVQDDPYRAGTVLRSRIDQINSIRSAPLDLKKVRGSWPR